MNLLNAFSLGMLPVGVTKVTFADVNLDQARSIAARGFDSAVGHADTAAVMSDLLGVPVATARVSVAIPIRTYGIAPWQALVGQYLGPRLPEGATSLPNGAVIRWVTVYVD
ncbi:MAG: DUF1874 domain-containing protein [Polaromonas sp.]|nr:DUF1874 domain-containing protein [Polaromonas sp.]